MSAKIYIGNLAWTTDETQLRATFSEFGAVLDAVVMKETATGRSRGFGFVTYGSQQEADTAISTMNEQTLDGRKVRVNVANQRTGGTAGASHYASGYPSNYAPHAQGYHSMGTMDTAYPNYAQNYPNPYSQYSAPNYGGFSQNQYPSQSYGGANGTTGAGGFGGY